jgi:hypothetical protein
MKTYKMTKTEVYYIEAGSEQEAYDLLNGLDNGSASRVDVDAEEVTE